MKVSKIQEGDILAGYIPGCRPFVDFFAATVKWRDVSSSDGLSPEFELEIGMLCVVATNCSFWSHPIPLLLSYGWRIVFIRWRLTWNWEVVLFFFYFLYFLSSLYFLWLMSPLTHVTLIHTVAFRCVLMGCQIDNAQKGDLVKQACLLRSLRSHCKM